MIGSIIIIIVLLITMLILEILLNTLYSSKGIISDDINKDYYKVSIPNGAILGSKIQFWFGVFLFVLFGISKIDGNESITIGNFIICILICFFGLWAEISLKNKKIIVNNDTIIIHKFLQKEKVLNIKDIEFIIRTKKTRYGTASQIVISNNNKVLIRIDDLFQNYNLLEERIKSMGKNI